MKLERSPKGNKRPFATQANFFGATAAVQTCVIRRRADFENLFNGFRKMKAVSFVASPELLLEFIDKRGYEQIEILVGENLCEPYRRGLEQKGLAL